MDRARIPALVLAVAGVALTAGSLLSWLGYDGPPRAPWWLYLFLVALSVALAALAAAAAIEPRILVVRQALAGSALGWLVFLGSGLLLRIDATSAANDSALLLVLVAVVGIALAGLTTTTGDVATPPGDPVARLGVVVVFGVAILMAAGGAVIIASLGRAIWRSLSAGQGFERLPWGLVVLIIVLPVVTFILASVGARRASGGTFYAQATANRRNSLLLVVTLVGVVAATAEIIVVTVTFKPVPALWTAVIAACLGLGAAALANRYGGAIILETAGARQADPKDDAVLLNVVQELAIATGIPTPRVFVIGDRSQNAFATGRDPQHAAVAVTTGLLDQMDREQLQGVVAHELAHIRNLDTRYALYVAVLVGLVAIATDGFLQMVVEGWKNGVFTSTDSDDNPVAALAFSLLMGIFLLVVASLLRFFAPLFATLVQASTSREREFLADATSVELTRNPKALERALEAIAADTDPLDGANRGTQHLWFRNPVTPDRDRRVGWLSTHPSLGARIDRLRKLQGLEPLSPAAAAVTSVES